MINNLETLYLKLQYRFSDETILQQALTHSSYSNESSNERLEFLGDSIVNFIIADALFEQLTTVQEGWLSRYRSELVRGQTLAQIAQELNLGDHLLLGAGERKTGGQKRESILADVLEAVIAAIYLDSDMQTCQRCVVAWFGERLDEENIMTLLKDPKSALQEYLQAHKLPLPEYLIQRTQGQAHQQIFYVVCKVATISYQSEGKGKSKRRAEQVAAQAFLKYLQEQYEH